MTRGSAHRDRRVSTVAGAASPRLDLPHQAVIDLDAFGQCLLAERLAAASRNARRAVVREHVRESHDARDAP